jgi:hypothetical protein
MKPAHQGKEARMTAEIGSSNEWERTIQVKGGGGQLPRRVHMKLAELINRTLTDPAFRLAIEAGTASVEHPDLCPDELEGLTEVMRRFKNAASKKVLEDIHALGLGPDWRDD